MRHAHAFEVSAGTLAAAIVSTYAASAAAAASALAAATLRALGTWQKCSFASQIRDFRSPPAGRLEPAGLMRNECYKNVYTERPGISPQRWILADLADFELATAEIAIGGGHESPCARLAPAGERSARRESWGISSL